MINQAAAAASGGGALLTSTYKSCLKFANPVPPLFSKRRRNNNNNNNNNISSPLIKPLTLAASSSDTSKSTSSSSSSSNLNDGGVSNTVSFVGQDSGLPPPPLEGVIQFEKPTSNSLISKWGMVGVLGAGDVAALLLFSAIGRFSHGFPVFEYETFKTADPFIAGWFLSAYFLGGYGDEGKGKNGLWRAVTAAAKSWSLGIPLGLVIRATSIGHIPPTNFMLVTMGSTAVLLIGWRALLFTIFPSDKGKKNDVYKRGSPFELFELLTSLVRRW